MNETPPAYGWHHGSYTPTPEEIRIECEKIQASWSPAERQRRAGWYAEQERITIPTGIDLGNGIEFIEAQQA